VCTFCWTDDCANSFVGRKALADIGLRSTIEANLGVCSLILFFFAFDNEQKHD
jgi:hypothetical protein